MLNEFSFNYRFITMAASRRRRFYFSIGCLLCFVYTFHVSFRSLIQFDAVDCDESVFQKQQQLAAAFRSEKTNSSRDKHDEVKGSVELSLQFDRSDYFGCDDFKKLPLTIQSRPENAIGNRGISFLKIRINGITIPAVYKVANK